MEGGEENPRGRQARSYTRGRVDLARRLPNLVGRRKIAINRGPAGGSGIPRGGVVCVGHCASTCSHLPTHPKMIFGPTSLSLAPRIAQSKSLLAYFKPIAAWYIDLMGYRKYGLKYDDLSAFLRTPP